jgi:integrase/recombinase XerD
MTGFAPTLQAFFTDRLVRQRRASPQTVAAYRDAIKLLLAFAQQHTGKQPSDLDLADIDVELVGAFLDHLEHELGNTPRTRNARLRDRALHAHQDRPRDQGLDRRIAARPLAR